MSKFDAVGLRIDGDMVTFSTGREFVANFGIIGISPNLEVYEGYDGHVFDGPADLSEEERRELADHMIERWIAFGKGATSANQVMK